LNLFTAEDSQDRSLSGPEEVGQNNSDVIRVTDDVLG